MKEIIKRNNIRTQHVEKRIERFMYIPYHRRQQLLSGEVTL